ncbi:hypothetical protein D8771_26435 [Streptomyces albus]|uniref:3'-5' exonuclease domain-containing protein n=1 Tax=Streptomyces albus TaxID=1888 RepID=A0A8H1L6M0_9ACTN|nr:hypothetical protein D8771_26435 [Streptomyces albus]
MHVASTRRACSPRCTPARGRNGQQVPVTLLRRPTEPIGGPPLESISAFFSHCGARKEAGPLFLCPDEEGGLAPLLLPHWHRAGHHQRRRRRIGPAGFRDFVRQNKRICGFDTETTGLSIYQPGYRVRLTQFGNATEAWAIPVERGEQLIGDVLGALRHIDQLVMHNSTFDILSLDQWSRDLRADELFPKLLDSKITAHLVDSRG